MTKSIRDRATVFFILCVSANLLILFSSQNSYGSRIETTIQTVWSMGVWEIAVVSSKSDLVRINCNETNDFLGGSTIAVTIQNRPPVPNSFLAFVLDGNKFRFKTNEDGKIATDNRLAADNFIALVKELSRAKTLDINLSDGRSLQISVNHKKTDLPELQCTTAFYSPERSTQIDNTTEPQPNDPSVLKGEYETNVDVNVETDGVSSLVVVTSLRDQVTIQKVTINRGNCSSTGFLTHRLPHRLLFGQGSVTMSIFCDVREVEVVTDHGPELFTFR